MIAREASQASLLQPVMAGLLAAVVGFGSSFAVVLQGLAAAGASPVQAASGLLALSVAMGLLAISLSLIYRIPIAVAWSTPGAALLVSAGMPEGGFAAAVGAFLAAAALIVIAGAWRRFGSLVAAIPAPLANAMLAGVLLDLCLAPVRAVAAMPTLALPIVLVWALAYQFARLYAVPIAVLVTAGIVLAATPIPSGALADTLPHPVLVMPTFSINALIGIGLPMFLVTMASQNVPGLAVMRANGYRPDVATIFVSSGLASFATSLLGGHLVNLAAITAALCAGPEAHADPDRRWIAAVANGCGYVALGLFATFAAAFIAASPPLLIEAVAGLALLGALGGALSNALSAEPERLAAIMTFVTTASGVSMFGIGGAFWGLVVGGAMLTLQNGGRRRGASQGVARS